MSSPKPNSLLEQYQRQLQTNPVRTKAIGAAILSGLSDIIAQRLADPNAPFNRKSFMNQVLVGLLVRGPVVHYWYQALERLFEYLKVRKDDFMTAVKKMLVDQVFFSPLFNLAYFYVMGFLEGLSLEQIRANVRSDFGTVMSLNYRVWPFVILFNFRYVPPKFRELVGNLVGVLWTVVVIMATRGDAPKATAVVELN